MNQNSSLKGNVARIIILLICLASMNFLNAYYYLVIAIIGVYFLLNPKINIDFIPMLFLLLLGVSILIFSPSSDTTIFAPVKPFLYVLCYVIGASMLSLSSTDDKKTSFKLFNWVLFAIGLGLFIHYALNWISNIDSLERNTIDFWTGKVLAATGQAAFACIPLALSISCLFAPSKKWMKVAAIITIVVIMLYNLILSGRSLLVILVALVAVAFSHKFLKLEKRRARMLLVALLVLLALVFAYQMNLFGLRAFIESTPIYDRFFGSNNLGNIGEVDRISRKIIHLQNMASHWWGGANIRAEYGYAHDIFLDTYDEAGVLAFIAISVYMLITLSHLIKCIRDDSLPFTFRQTVICLYVGVYIEFMVEPILQGMPWMFALFCLIDGYVARLLRHNKKVKESALDEGSAN